MDFLFSPLAGLVTAFVLQGGPILPSAADFSGWTTPPVEQHAAAPVMAPSIDRVLLLPNGFRAPGYEALTISKAGN